LNIQTHKYVTQIASQLFTTCPLHDVHYFTNTPATQQAPYPLASRS